MNNDLISREYITGKIIGLYSDGEKANNKDKVINEVIDIIDNAPTVELEELKEIRNICEHWSDKSSSFVSACNAFEDILHIFRLGVDDMKGGAE